MITHQPPNSNIAHTTARWFGLEHYHRLVGIHSQYVVISMSFTSKFDHHNAQHHIFINTSVLETTLFGGEV